MVSVCNWAADGRAFDRERDGALTSAHAPETYLTVTKTGYETYSCPSLGKNKHKTTTYRSRIASGNDTTVGGYPYRRTTHNQTQNK